MARIDVWDLKKGMELFEDCSIVTHDAGYITVLSDPITEDGQYYSCDVRREDGSLYSIGANKEYPVYGPSLYSRD